MGRADDDIATRRHHGRDPLGLQICTVNDADLACDDGSPVEPFAFLLVGQLEGREAFVVEVPDAMHAPDATALAAGPIGLGDHGRIDEPDRTHARQGPHWRWEWRCRRDQHARNQSLEPRHRFAHTLENGDVRDRGEPHGLGPGRRQPQPLRAQAIGGHDLQHVDRTLDLAGAPEGAGLARLHL